MSNNSCEKKPSPFDDDSEESVVELAIRMGGVDQGPEDRPQHKKRSVFSILRLGDLWEKNTRSTEIPQ